MSPVDRFTPLHLGRGVWTANRVVVPPMASSTAGTDGVAGQATVAHYRNLAQAGAGLTFVEYTYVDPTGRSEEQQTGITTQRHADGLAVVAATLREHGTLPGLQLTHAGGKSARALTGGPLPTPSGVTVPVKDRELEAPDAMTSDDIAQWRAAFIAAALRGARAGFAVLELHAAHGYGFNQWLSPLTNQRTDAYGGSLTRRARLLLETVAGIRLALAREGYGDTLLAVRMPGQDHLPGGLTSADAVRLARLLVSAGVDIIDVSSGVGGWRRPRERDGEGYLVADAAPLARAVDVPVIGVGGIESAAYIDAALARGELRLAAVGRAILADAAGFRERVLAPALRTRLQYHHCRSSAGSSGSRACAIAHANTSSQHGS